jgi:cobalt-zinc-cadmium efflux system outer membrane protein
MTRTFITLGLMCGLATTAFAQGAPSAPMTLEKLQEIALARNPSLTAARADIDVARGRALEAGQFPNPTVGYTGEEISGGPTIRGGEHGVFIEQTIPISGKLGLSRAVFTREAEQAEALAAAQRQRVMNMVRALYFEALVAERQIEAADRIAAIAREAVDIAKQLYNVGLADHPDVLESEVEDQRARIEVTSAKNRRDRVWLRLAAAVGDPALTPAPLAGNADATPTLDREQVLARVLRESPEIKAARAAIDRGGAAVSRAKRETTPDLFLRGGPRYNRELLESSPITGAPRPVGWEATVEVGVTIPLWNRNQGGIAAAQADRTRAEAELTRLELGLRSRLAGVFAEYATARQSAETYRVEVLPRAEQAYQMYLKRYREMAAAYPQVLNAQRSWAQAQRDYLDALATTWRTAVQLEGFLLDDSENGAQ